MPRVGFPRSPQDTHWNDPGQSVKFAITDAGTGRNGCKYYVYYYLYLLHIILINNQIFTEFCLKISKNAIILTMTDG